MSEMRLAEIEQFRPVLCDCQIEWFKLIDQKLDDLGYGDGYSFIYPEHDQISDFLKLKPAIMWEHVWFSHMEYFTFYYNQIRYRMHCTTYDAYYATLKNPSSLDWALLTCSQIPEIGMKELLDYGGKRGMTVVEESSAIMLASRTSCNLLTTSNLVQILLTSNMSGSLVCSTCGKIFVDDEGFSIELEPGQYPVGLTAEHIRSHDGGLTLGLMNKYEPIRLAMTILTKHRENLSK